MTAPLDDVSKEIIAKLQVDGRRSYAAIAKEVGLSEAAVRQRVQRLTESGVMQIVAVTDPLQLGFAKQAMVGVKVKARITQVAERIAEIPEIDYVVVTTGRFDVLAEVVCESDDALLALVGDTIAAMDDVTSTETFVYLKLAKQTYSWGVR